MGNPTFKIIVRGLEDPTKTHEITHFTQFTQSLDIMQAIGTFTCNIGGVPEQREFLKGGGQKVEVYADGNLQLTAIADEKSEDTATTGTDLMFSGRCVGGILIDSSIQLKDLSIANLTIEQIAQKWVAPWWPNYIPAITADYSASRYIASGSSTTKGGGSATVIKTGTDTLAATNFYAGVPVPVMTTAPREWVQQTTTEQQKVISKGKPFGRKNPSWRGTTEPMRIQRMDAGAKILESLNRLSAECGCHIWFGVDGTLVIGRPCYDFSPTAYGEGLVLKWDNSARKASGGNVMGVRLETSIAARNSHYWVYGQGKGKKKTTMGKALTKHQYFVADPSPGFWIRKGGALSRNLLYKPEVITVKSLGDEKLLRRAVRTYMEQRAMSGFSLDYKVQGHHAPSGALWTIDSMVNVTDQRNGFDAQPFYIKGVDRRYDMTEGKTTLLKLMPPYIWLSTDHDLVDDSTYLADMINKIWW